MMRHALLIVFLILLPSRFLLTVIHAMPTAISTTMHRNIMAELRSSGPCICSAFTCSDCHKVGLSPTGGIRSFKNFSTSSISSGSAECSSPGYIFSSTSQPSFFRISAVICPHCGRTKGSESPCPIKIFVSLFAQFLSTNSAILLCSSR